LTFSTPSKGDIKVVRTVKAARTAAATRRKTGWTALAVRCAGVHVTSMSIRLWAARP
jgi:hypothetical protein